MNDEFSDKAIEKELFKDDKFSEFRSFLKNSLKANFWICEGLNMIALIYHNLNPEISDSVPFAQEMGSVDIDTTYNPRQGQTAQDIYSAYEVVRDSKKYNYEDVVNRTPALTREKLAKWTYSSYGLSALPEDSEIQYTYGSTWGPLITYLRDIVIPYLEDNGY